MLGDSVESDSLSPHGLAALQAPLSTGFPRQEYWRGLLFPSPEDLPDQGLNLCVLHWQGPAWALLPSHGAKHD